jgi:hypothetical protein
LHRLEIGAPELIPGRPEGLPHIVGRELRFWSSGKYRAGATEAVIPLRTRMIAVVPSLKFGYVQWRKNEENESVAISVFGDMDLVPNRDALSMPHPKDWTDACYLDDPWQLHALLLMVDPATGEAFTFVASGQDEIAAVAYVRSAFKKRARKWPGELPVIELATGGYYCRTIKVHYPVFKIIDWTQPPGGRSSGAEDVSPMPVAPVLTRVT